MEEFIDEVARITPLNRGRAAELFLRYNCDQDEFWAAYRQWEKTGEWVPAKTAPETIGEALDKLAASYEGLSEAVSAVKADMRQKAETHIRTILGR